jgi:hypothetical protein
MRWEQFRPILATLACPEDMKINEQHWSLRDIKNAEKGINLNEAISGRTSAP